MYRKYILSLLPANLCYSPLRQELSLSLSLSFILSLSLCLSHSLLPLSPYLPPSRSPVPNPHPFSLNFFQATFQSIIHSFPSCISHNTLRVQIPHNIHTHKVDHSSSQDVFEPFISLQLYLTCA